MIIGVSLQSKTCSKCEEVKTLDEFTRNRANKDGYRSECKVCRKNCRSSNDNRNRILKITTNRDINNFDIVRSAYGCVYMFRDSANKALKVGFTTDLANRTKQHKTSNPFLILVGVILKVDMQTEKRLHDRLESYRLTDTQEWYEECLDVLDIFNSYDPDKALNNIRRLRLNGLDIL